MLLLLLSSLTINQLFLLCTLSIRLVTPCNAFNILYRGNLVGKNQSRQLRAGNLFDLRHNQQKRHRCPPHSIRRCTILLMNPSSADDTNGNDDRNYVQEILESCALDRNVDSKILIETLKSLEKQREDTLSTGTTSTSIPKDLVTGAFELIFSSSVANLPVVGFLCKGYMPNREIISFDFDDEKGRGGKLKLDVETIPNVIPTITIIGDDLMYNEETNTISYKVRKNDKKDGASSDVKTSEWKILYATDKIVAAKSSVTGYNVIRRI